MHRCPTGHCSRRPSNTRCWWWKHRRCRTARQIATLTRDSPVIGAGTYADNASVAVSATGVGEVFMRVVAAHDIAALVRYQGRSARAAAEEVILRKIPSAGGRGGAIVLDRRGNLAMVFNTEGMYRGAIRGDGKPEIDI